MIILENIPQVAISAMNKVHDEEATLLNRLEDILKRTPVNHDEIALCLHEIIEHTRGHFANELNLMNEVGFPAKIMHDGEHTRVFNEMQRVVSNWLSTKDNNILEEYFLDSMQEWLGNHILTMDTITAQFIANAKSL